MQRVLPRLYTCGPCCHHARVLWLSNNLLPPISLLIPPVKTVHVYAVPSPNIRPQDTEVPALTGARRLVVKFRPDRRALGSVVEARAPGLVDTLRLFCSNSLSYESGSSTSDISCSLDSDVNDGSRCGSSSGDGKDIDNSSCGSLAGLLPSAGAPGSIGSLHSTPSTHSSASLTSRSNYAQQKLDLINDGRSTDSNNLMTCTFSVTAATAAETTTTAAGIKHLVGAADGATTATHAAAAATVLLSTDASAPCDSHDARPAIPEGCPSRWVLRFAAAILSCHLYKHTVSTFTPIPIPAQATV